MRTRFKVVISIIAIPLLIIPVTIIITLCVTYGVACDIADTLFGKEK